MTCPGPALIRFDRVCRTYSTGAARVRALDDVSFAIAAGEFVAIMGPSGSGKSTAMNLIGCLDATTGGRYLFAGTDMRQIGRRGRTLVRRSFLGFVFQGFNLLPRASALENVELPLLYRGEPRGNRRRRAEAALARVGLSGREDHLPGALSGGQQQRVAIARAIVTEPAVLLADEPTGNLDSASSAEVMDLLAGMNRDLGLTLVVVTHEATVGARARRVLRFRDGRLERDGAALAGPAAGC